MSPKFVSFLALLAIAAVAVSSKKTKQTDIKAKAEKMVEKIRRFATKAKKGMELSKISEKAQLLEEAASKLFEKLPDKDAGCEAELVIKTAAAKTGSHEVLTLLQAGDHLGVLNGRLSLSLAFLANVAQQMEDELVLSDDIGGHLTALIYGANMTNNIVQDADTVLQDAKTESKPNENAEVAKKRPKRTWGLSRSGVTWTSSSGRTSIGVKPTFGGGGVGAQATFTYRF